MWPLKFMAQCQSKSIFDQYKAGCRFFDIRVVWNEKDSCWNFAHGLFKLKGDISIPFTYLSSVNTPVYVRVINEQNKNEDKFIEFCKYLHITFPKIRFCGGSNKKAIHTPLYWFGWGEPASISKYSSCNNDTKLETGWHLDDLFPRLYAMCFNKKWRKVYKDYPHFLIQDFIDKY